MRSQAIEAGTHVETTCNINVPGGMILKGAQGEVDNVYVNHDGDVRCIIRMSDMGFTVALDIEEVNRV